MSKIQDSAGQVRQGEELDISALSQWLEQVRAQQPGLEKLTGQPKVTQYSGGASNWTYCLDFAEQSVILRRAPAGRKAKGAHDMGREYHLQQALKPHYPLVPQMLGHCADENVIGSEFYLMEKLNGLILRKNKPRDLSLGSEQCQQLCKNALDGLLDLHKIDYQSANLHHLGKGSGYAQRQIEGWIKRYQQAKTWNVPRGKAIAQWLTNNLPQHEHICLTHNDYRFDNLVLDTKNPTNILGVLDWELATLGDPLMDLGNSLAYWVEATDDRFLQTMRRQPTHLPGMFTRQQVIEYYLEHSGQGADNFAFYQVYGLYRLAAIIQQIYYRYHHKQTRNPTFKHAWLFVHYLLWRCRGIIKGKYQ